jgi:RHS repeat-associated protein
MNNAAGDEEPTKGGSMQNAGGVGGLLKEGDWYPTYDANGNVMQKLDGTGTAEMSVDYDPFGNIISGSLVGEYGFSTKPLVEGLDWYYYGYRYYDPLSGRWQSRDPMGERGGVNLYAMVGNDPLSYSDYLGKYGSVNHCMPGYNCPPYNTGGPGKNLPSLQCIAAVAATVGSVAGAVIAGAACFSDPEPCTKVGLCTLAATAFVGSIASYQAALVACSGQPSKTDRLQDQIDKLQDKLNDIESQIDAAQQAIDSDPCLCPAP